MYDDKQKDDGIQMAINSGEIQGKQEGPNYSKY